MPTMRQPGRPRTTAPDSDKARATLAWKMKKAGCTVEQIAEQLQSSPTKVEHWLALPKPKAARVKPSGEKKELDKKELTFWARQDWRRTDTELARSLGFDTRIVKKWRNKLKLLGRDTTPEPAPTDFTLEQCLAAGLGKMSDRTVAMRLNTSMKLVHAMRRKYGVARILGAGRWVDQPPSEKASRAINLWRNGVAFDQILEREGATAEQLTTWLKDAGLNPFPGEPALQQQPASQEKATARAPRGKSKPAARGGTRSPKRKSK